MLAPLLDIGPLSLHSFGVFLASGVFSGLAWAMHEARKTDLSAHRVPELGFYTVLGAIFGARLLYICFYPEEFLDNPANILLFWRGGLLYPGALLGGIASALLFLRAKNEPCWIWSDILVSAFALGESLGRLGCLSAGCGYGKSTTVRWAIEVYDTNSLSPLFVPLHPTQLYFSLMALFCFTFLTFINSRRHTPGLPTALLLVFFCSVHGVIEFFRGDPRPMLGGLSLTQWLMIAGFALGITLFITRSRHHVS